MSRALKILLVEDQDADAKLTLRILQEGGLHITSVQVSEEAGFRQALHEFSPDLVLSENSLSDLDGIAVLRLLRESQREVPIIFVSRTGSDGTAIELLRRGAADYIPKGDFMRLIPAVEGVLHSVALQREKRASETQYRDIFHHALVGIFQVTPDGQYLTMNSAFASFHGYGSPAEMIEAVTGADRHLDVRLNEFREAIAALERNGVLKDFHVEHYRRDGSRIWLALDIRAVRNEDERVLYYEGFALDVSKRKEVEANLESAQSRLIEASRHAGMAEVAASVLHNVGNVLTSVNVSTSLLNERVQNSPLPNLARAVSLLREHEDDLVGFVRDDPKAKQLVSFLDELSQSLEKEREGILAELQSLRSNIEHINTIVVMQQHYTTMLGVTETVKAVDLMEDALRVNAASIVCHGVEIRREYADVPPFSIERHKVLQILVNLISNAKYALDGVAHERVLTLRVGPGRHGFITLSVMENGSGIPPENLTRIFEHGFTTRKGGHGFGLHSSALAARELGGSLSVASDGLGCGATFTLELPIIESDSNSPSDVL